MIIKNLKNLKKSPYIKLTWQHKHDGYKGYKKPGTIDNIEINKATLHHITSSEHHPEYWTNRSTDLINKNDRDKVPDQIVDATKMPLEYIACMVSDWMAMSEELKNCPYDWADKNVNKRWLFTNKQKELIYRILNNVWNSKLKE